MLDIVNDIWKNLKPYLNSMDHVEAADQVVSTLIDMHGFTAEEIQDEFKDPLIRRALAPYLEHEEVDEDDEDDEEDYDFEEDY